MTDLHIVDDQSPMRVEFLDRYSLEIDPYDGSYPTAATTGTHWNKMERRPDEHPFFLEATWR